MSLSGSRGLIRISRNDGCELQAAMVAEGVSELEFYRRVTGRDYPREYGERVAARRRGAKFEANLFQNDAALLRKALGPMYGLDPDTMVVRNFAEEVPGARFGIRALRLQRTRNILKDTVAGRDVPHLLIQPQLVLPIGPGPRDVEHVSPDIMVFDPRVQIYRPGEVKSFIVRDGVADKADLDGTRRQAAGQVLALKAEAARVGLADRVNDNAVFVFATPYGLAPAAPFEETLQGPMREIREAAAALLAVRHRLAELRRVNDAPLHMLVDELEPNFQDSCVGTCVMVDFCRGRSGSETRILGDQVSRLLGRDLGLDRVVALMRGASPATPRESEVLALLNDAVGILPRLRQELQRRIA